MKFHLSSVVLYFECSSLWYSKVPHPSMIDNNKYEIRKVFRRVLFDCFNCVTVICCSYRSSAMNQYFRGSFNDLYTVEQLNSRKRWRSDSCVDSSEQSFNYKQVIFKIWLEFANYIRIISSFFFYIYIYYILYNHCCCSYYNFYEITKFLLLLK